MLTGFNTNVPFRGETYHVQTEDSGEKASTVTTLLYLDGTILSRKSFNYAELLNAGGWKEKVCFDGVTKSYGPNVALRDVSFSMGKGELCFLTGPSGAGKSTLLKLIYMAERPDSGSVYFDGVDTSTVRQSRVPWLRRRIGVVFQDFRLLPRPVFDNVALALRIRGMHESDIKPVVNETLKLVGLRHKSDAYPKALSGGEQQRVVIARAIAGEPSVLLADEPTGNLDPDTAAGIMRVFREINARGTTVLVATHNRELLKSTGNFIFRLDGGTIREELFE
ncbi:MAG: cell division ATP-binding protein FtsE [Nitrospirota bacterium]